MNLRRQAAVVLETGGDVGDVVFRFDNRLSGVARLECRQLGGPLSHKTGKLQQNPPALDGRGARPLSFVEDAAGRSHRAIDVLGGRIGNGGNDLACGGIDDFALRAGARHEAAVHEERERVRCVHRCRSCGGDCYWRRAAARRSRKYWIWYCCTLRLCSSSVRAKA
jgi:hypothetical protein